MIQIAQRNFNWKLRGSLSTGVGPKKVVPPVLASAQQCRSVDSPNKGYQPAVINDILARFWIKPAPTGPV